MAADQHEGNPMGASYDPEADALYVRFLDEPVATGFSAGDNYAVDLAPDGRVRGVEMLGVRAEAERIAADPDHTTPVERVLQEAGYGPVPRSDLRMVEWVPVHTRAPRITTD